MKARLKMKPLALKFAKCALTALIVAGIALALVSLGEDAEVPSTQADIVTGLFAPATKTARFADALGAMGHPEPLALDLNGNRVFFSSKEIEGSPEAALCEYQQEFVRQELNAEAFCDLGFGQHWQRKRASFSGGVVPMLITPEHVLMSGVEQRDGRDSSAELLAGAASARQMAEVFGPYRVVEILQEEGAKKATALAMWSDESFDYAKMFPVKGRQARQAVDPQVPICTGCLLVNSLGDAAAAGVYQTYTFTATQSPLQVGTFYQEQLKASGWDKAGHSPYYDLINQAAPPEHGYVQPLQFERADLSMSVHIYPLEEPAGTGVHVTLADRAYLESKKLLVLQADEPISAAKNDGL